MLTRLKQLATTTSQPVAEVARPANTTTVNLPILELPTFSGNYQDWFSFYDLFVALVHNNGTLSPAQKLHYLKTTLKGEASRLLSSIQVTDANYNEAWSILVGRYQNKRQIIQSHIKSLFNQPTLLQESASGLRRLLDSTVEHVRALHVLNEPTEHWDTILVHILVERMDADSRRQWELSTPSTELPSFDEVKTFLENRCRALDASGTSKQVRQPQGAGRSPGPSHSRMTTSSYSVINRASCIICKAEHLLHQCPTFLNKTIADRTSVIRKHMLCFNCLRANHKSNQCKSSSCRKCNQRHHTLLHFDQPTTELSTEMQQVVTHNTSIHHDHSEVLLLTALVQIPDKLGEYQLCRALIDSGSQSSFISEPCAQRLRLQRLKACLPIQGIGNARSVITQGKVSLQVVSRVGNHSLSLNAFVIPRITGPLPITRLENQNWQHLNNLNLADPTYYVPKDIDLLLGADVFSELFLEGKLTGINGAPSAQNTIFGWVLSGKVSASNTSGTCTRGVVSNLVRDADKYLQKMWESEEITETKSYTQEEHDCDFKKYTPDQERKVNGSIDGPDVQKKRKKPEEDNRTRGFEQERIIGTTVSSGELMSLIKWKGSEEVNLETKPTKSLISTCVQDEDLLSRVSTLTKLKKVTAYCLRFIHNSRAPINQRKWALCRLTNLNQH